MYFRVGGPHVGKATTTMEVNSDNVLIDHIWAWRADHGAPGSFGWDVNTARNGVVVNGDHVTATGLFVEHYQQYNVIWNGEYGQTVFFQNELPYDAPNQAAWQHDGILGWAAYKVADTVKHHELWGGGSYIFTNVDPTIHAAHGFEVPVTPGVVLHHVHDGQPQRRHDRPRGQRHRNPGGQQQHRHAELRHAVPRELSNAGRGRTARLSGPRSARLRRMSTKNFRRRRS